MCCASGNARAQRGGRESVVFFGERERQFVFLLDQEQKKKESVCAALLCEDLRMDIWRLEGTL